jgi:hypothetical protein
VRRTADRFAERALQSLPPPPRANEPPAAWWARHGKLFMSFFKKYGTDAIMQASLGGMVEHRAWYPTSLQAAMGPDLLVKDAEIDFTSATGIGSHTGTLDPRWVSEPLAPARLLVPRGKLDYACH